MGWSQAFALLGSACSLVLMTPGAASAERIVFTHHEKLSESFTEPFACQDELYDITGTGHIVEHLTARPGGDGSTDTPFRYHFAVHASMTAVPSDGTGPTYVAHFHSSDSETIRSVKNGELLVETDTDHNKMVAKGSDGSKVRFQEHHHFTINANGEVSVEFEQMKASC